MISRIMKISDFVIIACLALLTFYHTNNIFLSILLILGAILIKFAHHYSEKMDDRKAPVLVAVFVAFGIGFAFLPIYRATYDAQFELRHFLNYFLVCGALGILSGVVKAIFDTKKNKP